MGKDNFKWMDQQPSLLGLQERIMQRPLYIETVLKCKQWRIHTYKGGDGHPNPEIRGRARPKKNYFFGLSRLSLAPRAPPLDPPLVNSCIL